MSEKTVQDSAPSDQAKAETEEAKSQTKPAPKGEPILEVKGLKKDYYSVQRRDAPLSLKVMNYAFGWLGFLRTSTRLWDPKTIIRGVDLKIYSDEILAITGKSGAGKSTLLHLLGAFDRPSEGQILYKGQDITKLNHSKISDFRNNSVGYVFQFYHLFSGLTALENVILPAMIRPDYQQQAKRWRERAEELLDKVKLAERMRHKPTQLSGGEQQRVAIARALLLEPELLLCDEPTGNLDTETGETILELLFQLREDERRSYVIVTHDEDVAGRADRHLKMHDGRIVET